MKVPKLIELVRTNIVQYNHPLGLSGSEISAWSRNLNLKSTGEVLLYTGGEYQLLPLLDSLSRAISLFQPDSKLFDVGLGIRELIGKVGLKPEKTYGKLLGKDADRYNSIPRQAALILLKAGVDLCYLGDKEIYSGALLKEFGYEDDFYQIAAKLGTLMKETQAKTIICLSPHSAEMFKFYYPEIDEWFKEVEIVTFTEYVLTHLPSEPYTLPSDLSVTIHDSCKMVRELKCGMEIRDFLKAKDISVMETGNYGHWTLCCGGPSKIMFPQLADCLGEQRFEELSETGAEVILSFCPYCLAALEKGRGKNGSEIKVLDFVEYLSGELNVWTPSTL